MAEMDILDLFLSRRPGASGRLMVEVVGDVAILLFDSRPVAFFDGHRVAIEEAVEEEAKLLLDRLILRALHELL